MKLKERQTPRQQVQDLLNLIQNKQREVLPFHAKVSKAFLYNAEALLRLVDALEQVEEKIANISNQLHLHEGCINNLSYEICNLTRTIGVSKEKEDEKSS